MPDVTNVTEAFFRTAGENKLGQYLADLYLAWKVLLIAVGVGFVFSLVYLVLVRCCASLLVWVTFIAFIVLVAVIGGFYYNEGLNSLNSGDQTNYKAFAIALWVIDGVLLLVILCLYDDIQLALGIITTAATFVFSNFCIILVPIITLIVSCAFVVYWIATVVFIYSVGTIKQYQNTPFASVDWDNTTANLWYYHLFALFWVLTFFIAAVQFIIAATAAQWYFSSQSDASGSGSSCKSFYWLIRYHLGSLAFGSLILAIIYFIQFIFEYMKKKVEATQSQNKFIKCLLWCGTCCLQCIGECVLFLTKNAYIQVSVLSITN